MDVNIQSLLPFCGKEFTDYRFQIGLRNGENFKADLSTEPALSFPLTPM